MFDVRVANKPEKFLKNLAPDYREAIKLKIDELKENFFPRGALPLSGRDRCYRIRVGPFRIQHQ